VARGITITHRHPWSVVAVDGDLDLATAPGLRQAVVALVAGGDLNVVIDLSATDFCDSVGLGMIVAASKRVRSHDGGFVVVCPDPRLRRLFSVTRLDRAISVVDDLAVALGLDPDGV
jgi:anti-sigma B factor antagonist